MRHQRKKYLAKIEKEKPDSEADDPNDVAALNE